MQSMILMGTVKHVCLVDHSLSFQKLTSDLGGCKAALREKHVIRYPQWPQNKCKMRLDFHRFVMLSNMIISI
jgi:hypothetical protein